METKTKMNVRTRKAIERERKKETNRMLKSQAKTALKIFLKTIIILLAIYVIFIIVEVVRFKNNLGIEPGLTFSEEIIEDSIVYKGFSYTVTYKYSQSFENFSYEEPPTDEDIVSGELKLFNKMLLSAWIK